MRILEVASDPRPDRLAGLVKFLAGRADDTGARKQISKAAFMSMAQQLGVNVTDQNLQDMVSRPPLQNMLEPIDPQSDQITFRGGEPGSVNMPVNKAQDIVAQAARSALQKRT
jgi:hypothetical protein